MNVDDEIHFHKDTPHFNTTSPALVTAFSDNYYLEVSPIRGSRISVEQRKHRESSAQGVLSEMSASLDWLRENPFGVLGVSRDFSAS